MIRPRHGEAGVTSVEFALCASLLVLLLTGTISLGVLTWTQAGLQSVAMQTSRCLALGSTACPNGQQFAVNLAQQRLFSGAITSSNVTVVSSVSCNGATGLFTQVTITSSYWSGGLLAPVFSGLLLSVRSCYPSHS